MKSWVTKLDNFNNCGNGSVSTNDLSVIRQFVVWKHIMFSIFRVHGLRCVDSSSTPENVAQRWILFKIIHDGKMRRLIINTCVLHSEYVHIEHQYKSEYEARYSIAMNTRGSWDVRPLFNSSLLVTWAPLHTCDPEWAFSRNTYCYIPGTRPQTLYSIWWYVRDNCGIYWYP